MVVAAELDPEEIVETVSLLGKQLCRPTLAVVPQHSHISQITSFGTADETMSAPVLSFIRSAAQPEPAGRCLKRAETP